MAKKVYFMFFCLIFFSVVSSISLADFDEKYWKMYAEIQIPLMKNPPVLGGVDVHPWLSEDVKEKPVFSSIRIITGNKIEAPYQIVAEYKGSIEEELPVKQVNLSITKLGETCFEGYIEKPSIVYNKIEILTDEKDFFRQVQVLGSRDGKNWNTIRRDAVIFDYSKEDNLRHLKITISDSSFAYIGVKIINNLEKQLKIKGLKVFYEKKEQGGEVMVSSYISKKDSDDKTKDSQIIMAAHYLYPINKIVLKVSDKNFQRRVEVLVKKDNEEWEIWGADTIFNFNTDKVKESKFFVEFPEVSTREIKILIKNYDNPPLDVSDVNVFGVKRILVFKLDEKQKYYMFWGNPRAKLPRYDISYIVSKQDIRSTKMFPVLSNQQNPKFVGERNAMPLTERHKYLLYGTIIIIIAGLIFLQYGVIKKTDKV